MNRLHLILGICAIILIGSYYWGSNNSANELDSMFTSNTKNDVVPALVASNAVETTNISSILVEDMILGDRLY